MSTIDQAFVQAFARRNRRATTTTNTRTSSQTSARVSSFVQNSHAVQSVDTDPRAIADQQGTVTSNESQSTDQANGATWIDPAKDNLLRIEQTQQQAMADPHLPASPTYAATQNPATQNPATQNPATQNPATQNAASHYNANPSSTAGHRNDSGDIDQPYITASSQGAARPPYSTDAHAHVGQANATSNQSRSGVHSTSDFVSPTLNPPAPSNRSDRGSQTSTGQSRVTQQRFDQQNPGINPPHYPAAAARETATATAGETATGSAGETATDPQSIKLEAAWEVDGLDIPVSVSELFFKEDLFQSVAQHLYSAVGEGLQSIMVTSAKAGEGRSTVSIGMALAAAAAGLRVALLDGDLAEPTLVDDLRLDVDDGWYDAIRLDVPLSQIAIFSIEDNLTLIPLVADGSQTSRPSEQVVQQLLESLTGLFDLIVVDAPSGEDDSMDPFAAQVDSAVIARDASRTDAQTVNELSARLRHHGLNGIGIVENFV